MLINNQRSFIDFKWFGVQTHLYTCICTCKNCEALFFLLLSFLDSASGLNKQKQIVGFLDAAYWLWKIKGLQGKGKIQHYRQHVTEIMFHAVSPMVTVDPWKCWKGQDK